MCRTTHCYRMTVAALCVSHIGPPRGNARTSIYIPKCACRYVGQQRDSCCCNSNDVVVRGRWLAFTPLGLAGKIADRPFGSDRYSRGQIDSQAQFGAKTRCIDCTHTQNTKRAYVRGPIVVRGSADEFIQGLVTGIQIKGSFSFLLFKSLCAHYCICAVS